jgi:putative flippase GtrA
VINEIIAFVLGFITAFILFAIIVYRQKKKLEQQIKDFDISMIKQLVEKSKKVEKNEK